MSQSIRQSHNQKTKRQPLQLIVNCNGKMFLRLSTWENVIKIYGRNLKMLLQKAGNVCKPQPLQLIVNCNGKMFLEFEHLSKCYKKNYSHNFKMFLISWIVCLWQAFLLSVWLHKSGTLEMCFTPVGSGFNAYIRLFWKNLPVTNKSLLRTSVNYDCNIFKTWARGLNLIKLFYITIDNKLEWLSLETFSAVSNICQWKRHQ